MASFNNSEINPTPIFTGETPDTLNIFPKGSGIINKNNPNSYGIKNFKNLEILPVCSNV